MAGRGPEHRRVASRSIVNWRRGAGTRVPRQSHGAATGTVRAVVAVPCGSEAEEKPSAARMTWREKHQPIGGAVQPTARRLMFHAPAAPCSAARAACTF